MQRTLSIDVSSATVGAARSFLDDGRSPVHGAPSSEEGGGIDSQTCASALERLESTYTQALVGAWTARSSADINSLWSAILNAFDSLGIGLAICDTAAKLLAGNPTADRTLEQGDALQLSESGELRTVARNAPVLAEAIKRLQQAGAKDRVRSQSKALLIPRKSGGRPMTVLLRRVDTGLSPGSSTQVVVMMLDTTLAVDATSSDLQQLFGFTPGETRLANLLMAGKSMAESCDKLGIRLSTGCSHLRKMFKKTKTHRQGELVALLLRSIGVLRNRIPVPGAGNERNGASDRDDVGSLGLIQVDVDSNL
jgi:DNA-binding CsgD family transcriptional regulator